MPQGAPGVSPYGLSHSLWVSKGIHRLYVAGGSVCPRGSPQGDPRPSGTFGAIKWMSHPQWFRDLGWFQGCLHGTAWVPGGGPRVSRGPWGTPGDPGDLAGTSGTAVAPGPPGAQLIWGSPHGTPESAGPQGAQGQRPTLGIPRGPPGLPGLPLGDPRGDPGNLAGTSGTAVAPGPPGAQLIWGSPHRTPESAVPQGAQGQRPAPGIPRCPPGLPGGTSGETQGTLREPQGWPSPLDPWGPADLGEPSWDP